MFKKVFCFFPITILFLTQAVSAIELGYTDEVLQYSLVQNNAVNQPQAQEQTEVSNKEALSSIVDREVQPPMENIFFNTLLGGVTGGLVGVAVSGLSFDKDDISGSISNVSKGMNTGITVGLVVGLAVGILLSVTEVEFDFRGSFESDNTASLDINRFYLDTTAGNSKVTQLNNYNPDISLNLLNVKF